MEDARRVRSASFQQPVPGGGLPGPGSRRRCGLALPEYPLLPCQLHTRLTISPVAVPSTSMR